MSAVIWRSDTGATLTVGDLTDCVAGWDGAVLHACKDPCWRRTATEWSSSGWIDPSWFGKGGRFYLSMGDQANFYLNLIDPPVPLFQPDSFARALRWLDDALIRRAAAVLVHCNLGRSRAPSIALLWLAHRGALPGTSYAEARAVFADTHPYEPGAGIATFLGEHWDELLGRPTPEA